MTLKFIRDEIFPNFPSGLYPLKKICWSRDDN